MQQPDDVRASLVKEIRRREHQLAGLRESLAQLDEALEAAAAAHAASVAAAERTIAAQVAATTRMVRSGVHTAAHAAPPPPPPPKPAERPKPAAPPPVESAPTPAAPAPAPVPPPAATPQPTHSSGAPIVTTHVAQRPSSPGRYANMKVWRAVQEMLTEHRKSMTLDEIVRHLQDGGASLGDSPMRTVSTAVGYMNDKIFHVSKTGGETYVNLLRPADQ